MVGLTFRGAGTSDEGFSSDGILTVEVMDFRGGWGREPLGRGTLFILRSARYFPAERFRQSMMCSLL